MQRNATAAAHTAIGCNNNKKPSHNIESDLVFVVVVVVFSVVAAPWFVFFCSGLDDWPLALCAGDNLTLTDD